MTPDEVLEELQRMNVNITRRTLLRYEKAKLITEPQRGGLGRGRGRVTDYPDEVASEAYAAYILMHGEPSYKPETIARIRQTTLNVIDGKQALGDLGEHDIHCIYWILFKMLFKEKIDITGSYWVSYEYVDRNFEDDFEAKDPNIPPNIDIVNTESVVTVIYLGKQGIAVKQLNPNDKKWTLRLFDKNTD